MSRHSLLREVHHQTDRWTLIVRVLRLWNIYQKASPSELCCTTMILVDKEGTKIQASLIPKDLPERCPHALTEGKTYFIANFVVSQNSSQYKATTHQFKIRFTQHTFIREEVADLPTQAFSFVPIPEILKTDEKHFTDYLIDVVAFVKTMGTLEEFRRDNQTKNKLKMLLTDINDNDVECVLFDECSTNAYMSQLENMETPVVVVLNLARIGWSEDGIPQICSSFNATRVLFNPPIPEVKELIESAKDRASPITTSLSQVMPTQSSQQSCSSILRNNYRIPISQIAEQKIGSSFVVNCLIHKLETRHGWAYDGCAKCATKPRDEGNNLVCPTCKKKPDSIEPKLKIHYTIVDDTRSASVVFWDKLASQLLGKNAAELQQCLKSQDREYDFPDQCDSVVGKRMLLKLKRNEYNGKYIASSISVQQYTLCEDLTEQFNEVSEQTSTDKVPQETADPIPIPDDNAAPNETLTHRETNESEDITLLELSQNTNPPAPKGKRKSALRRNVMDTNYCPESQPSSVSIPTSRMLKVVKQEKQ